MVDDGSYDAGYPGAEDEEEEEEWFGEGSAFDSGEDLAAALFSMAGVSGGAGPYEGEDDSDEIVHEGGDSPLEFQNAGTSTASAPYVAPPRHVTLGADTFQVVERGPAAQPAPAAGWGVRRQATGGGGTSVRTSWSMRHSVQFLKQTEEVIKKLRNEAIELTWELAVHAMQQADEPGKGKG